MSAFFGAIVGVIFVAVVVFCLIIAYCVVNESKKKHTKNDKDKYNQSPYKPFNYEFKSTDVNRLDKKINELNECVLSFEIEIDDVIDRINKLEIDLMNDSEKCKNSKPASSPDENKETDIPVITGVYSEKFNELVEETANKNKKKKAKDEKETKDEQH